jgi:hypothetical protein
MFYIQKVPGMLHDGAVRNAIDIIWMSADHKAVKAGMCGLTIMSECEVSVQIPKTNSEWIAGGLKTATDAETSRDHISCPWFDMYYDIARGKYTQFAGKKTQTMNVRLFFDKGTGIHTGAFSPELYGSTVRPKVYKCPSVATNDFGVNVDVPFLFMHWRVACGQAERVEVPDETGRGQVTGFHNGMPFQY